MTTPVSNDSWAARATITGASGISASNTTGYTIEASEKYTDNDSTVAQRISNSTAWWTWTAPAAGEVEFEVTGREVSIDVRTGMTSASNGTQVAFTNGRGKAAARVVFAAVSGTVYFIQVGVLNGVSAGTVTLTWAQPAPAANALGAAKAYKGRDTLALDDANVA